MFWEAPSFQESFKPDGSRDIGSGNNTHIYCWKNSWESSMLQTNNRHLNVLCPFSGYIHKVILKPWQTAHKFFVEDQINV